jgi:DNA replicative helicase MCM subunit Mcm2 (Cdc46/Mcm family)
MHFPVNATRTFDSPISLRKFSGKKQQYFILFIFPKRRISSDSSSKQNCPLDPYFVLPDSCKCVDSQTLKLQETPENVPNGEIPRHIQLYLERYLCDKAVPGNRITVTGIYSIKKGSNPGKVKMICKKILLPDLQESFYVCFLII